MKKIKNLKDLRERKLQLELELFTAEERMKEDVEWLKDELKPVRAVGKLFGHLMVNKNYGGVVDQGVRFTVDALLKNFVLAKAGWITKLIIPFMVKNLSTNYILEKRPEIFGVLRNLIHKARKSTNHNHNHYDKSTVDEMDY